MLLNLLQRIATWILGWMGIRSKKFVTSSSTKLHYFEAEGTGNLPPVVLVHGLGSSATSFFQMMRLMKRETKLLIAPDLSGHGWSDLPKNIDPEAIYDDLCEFLDARLEEPFVLFGNSLGGGLAIRYAIEHPEKVHSLILSSPAGAPLSQEEFLALEKLFQTSTRQEAKHFLKLLYYKVPFYGFLIEGFIIQTMKKPIVRSFFDSFRDGKLDELTFSGEQLQSLKMPVLLLWGSDERLLPESGLRFFEEHLPEHAVIERPERSGHSPYLERPHYFTQRIKNFVLQDSE